MFFFFFFFFVLGLVCFCFLFWVCWFLGLFLAVKVWLFFNVGCAAVFSTIIIISVCLLLLLFCWFWGI